MRHRTLLQEVDRADVILQTHILRGPLGLADHWPDVTETRLLSNVTGYGIIRNKNMIFTIILYFQSFPAKRSSKTSHV